MASNAQFKIDIYGDTTRFENSLKGIDTAMTGLRGEAKALRDALKLDPGNTEKIAQLQKNLQQQLKLSSDRTAELKKKIAGLGEVNPSNQAEWTKLNRQLQNSITTSSKLENELKDLGAEKVSPKVDIDTSRADESIKKVKNSFSVLKEVGIGALRSIGEKAVGAVSDGLGGWVRDAMTTQKAMISLENTMKFKGIGGQFSNVNSAMAKLATDTNANTEDTLKLATTFIGLGDNAQTAVSKTQNLVKANQAFGGTGENLKGVVMAYGQMSAAGKVTAENINQLTDNNTALGSALKSTVMEMNPALKQYGSFAGASEKGAISVEMLDKAMQKLGTAGGGAVQTIGDAWDSFNESMSLALLPTLQALTPVITAIINKMSDWGSSAGNIISGIVQYVQLLWYELESNGALKAFGSVWNSLKSIVGSVLTIFVELVQAFFKVDGATVKNATSMKSVSETIKAVALAFQKVASTIADFLNKLKNNQGAMDALKASIVAISVALTAFKIGQGIMTAISLFQKFTAILKAGKGAMTAFNIVAGMNPYVLIAGAIIAVIAGLTYFFAKTKTGQKIWADFVKFLQDSIKSIQQFFSGLGTWFGQLWQGIVNTAKTIWGGISAVFEFYIETYKQIFTTLIGFFSGLWNGIVQTASKVWGSLSGGFNTAVNAIKTGWDNLVKNVQGVIETIKGLWNGFTGFISGLFNSVVTIIQNVWTTVSTGVTAFVQGVITFFQPLIDFFGAIVNLIVSIFNLAWQLVLAGVRLVVMTAQTAWQGFVSALMVIITPIVAFFQTIWDGITSIVSSAISVLGSIWQAGVDLLISIYTPIIAVFQNILDAISNAVAGAVSAVIGYAQSCWNTIQSIWSVVAGWFASVWNAISSTASNAFNAVIAWASNAWNTIRNIWSAVIGWFSGVFNSVVNVASNAFRAIGSWAGNAVNTIKSVFASIGGWFSGVFNGVWNAVSSVFNGFGGFAVNAYNSIVGVFGGLGRWFSDLFNGISQSISDALGWVTDTINGIAKAINGISGKVSGLFRGSLVSDLPDVNYSNLGSGISQNSASADDNRTYNTFNIQGGSNQNVSDLARAIRREFNAGRA